MSAIRAVVVDPTAPARLALAEVDVPKAGPAEALVRVRAISLNRGEVRRAQSAEAGWRPGWDLAGTVETPALDGSGPPPGTRVVGLLPAGAWAELVTVPTSMLAELPDSVPFSSASTLPVAGLTALHAIEKGGSLLGRTVLITGASGGVGHLAVQLARNAGARVIGLVRQEAHAGAARAAGAHEVVVGEDPGGAQVYGPYHLIVDSVGGRTLGECLTMLAPNGICVNFGVSSGASVTFDAGKFFGIGGASYLGLKLFHEVARQPAGPGLARLARLIADGRLRPHVDVEAPWTEIGNVAQQLLDRRFVGKAVLTVSSAL